MDSGTTCVMDALAIQSLARIAAFSMKRWHLGRLSPCELHMGPIGSLFMIESFTLQRCWNLYVAFYLAVPRDILLETSPNFMVIAIRRMDECTTSPEPSCKFHSSGSSN